MNKHIPKGFGYYLRRMGSKPDTQDIDQLIKRLKASKASWASLMVESEDDFINPLSNLKPFADALKQNGIDVWVWTFPGSKRAASVSESEAAAKLATEYCHELKASGIMLDVEKAYKGKKKSLNALVNKTIELNKVNDVGIGFVSYPIPSFHRDIDWSCMTKCDFGSPMIYDTAKTKALVDKSYKEYCVYNTVWIPSMATYDTASAGTEEVQLKGDLDRVFEGNGDRNIPAAIFWAENTTNDAERKLIADYSNLLFK